MSHILPTSTQLTKVALLPASTLLVDKPLNWTSFQVVKKIRYHLCKNLDLKKIKCGHGGTLDPLATGLLIIGIGKDTKNLQAIQNSDKSYAGTIKLGVTTASYDAETVEENPKVYDHITAEDIERTRCQFEGWQDQVAPIFSAIKQDGKKLYDLARAGTEVVAPTRRIEITRLVITSVDLPYVHFEVDCSKGTYIRSFAHDFGEALGVGGYLTALSRTRIGDMYLADAWQLDDIVEALPLPA